MKDPVMLITGLRERRRTQRYHPHKIEHSADRVAVEPTTRQLASNEVAFTRLTELLKL